MKIPETYKELDNIVYKPNKQNWRFNNHSYSMMVCCNCGDECFQRLNYNGSPFCDANCRQEYMVGEHSPLYGKISTFKGRHHTDEAKQILREKSTNKCSGSGNPNYKGGVRTIALYDTYAHKLPNVVVSRKSSIGHLEVKCGNCNTWDSPNRTRIVNFIQNIKNDRINIRNYYCCKDCTYNSIEYSNIENTSEVKKRRSDITKGLWRDGIIDYRGDKSPLWKGGYKETPLYETYGHRLEKYEDIKRNIEDENILEVKCVHCDIWYIPSVDSVVKRLKCINGGMVGDSRFYCSDSCKHSCTIYGRKLYPKGFINNDNSRELQSSLRKLVLERDGYKCVKCGETENLTCHHIDPVICNPIESADIDNCVTLCEKHNREAHQIDGCGTHELRSNGLINNSYK